MPMVNVYTSRINKISNGNKKDYIEGMNYSFAEYLTCLFPALARSFLAVFSITALLNLAILDSIFLLSRIAAC